MEAAPVAAPPPPAPAESRDAPAEPRRAAASDVPPALEAAGRALAADPASFGFFQAVRLLERLHPGRARVGRFSDPASEVVRFSVHPSLAFPPGEVHALALREGGPASMSVNFMGLTGPQGVLPPHYTLLVGERARGKGEASAFGAFLDLFHHRVLSLFYRAWEKGRVALPAERGEDGPLRRRLLDLTGEGRSAAAPGTAGEGRSPAGRDPSRDEGAAGRDASRDGGAAAPDAALEEALVFYAGLFAPLPRGAAALEQLLGGVFGVRAAVEQFVGGWFPLAASEQCRLGGDGDGAADRLGMGAVVGDQAWHPQSGIRIRLGPLDRREYDRFLPTGPAYPLLKRLVRFYTHDQFEVELQLVLAGSEVPACTLGAQGADAQPLGWSTWARSRPMARDADDTLLRL